MNFDPSLPDDSRRNFVKKSLAASIIAAQPTILAGLIRAQGGGGGTGITDPWGTTDPWETTGFGPEIETTTVQQYDIESIVVTGNAEVVQMPVGGHPGPSYNETNYFDIDIPGKWDNVAAQYKIKFWQYPADASVHPSVATLQVRGEFSLWAPPTAGGAFVNVTKDTEKKQCKADCDVNTGIIAGTLSDAQASGGNSATFIQSDASGTDTFEVSIDLLDVEIVNNNSSSIVFKGEVKVTVKKNGSLVGANPGRPFEITVTSHLHP